MLWKMRSAGRRMAKTNKLNFLTSTSQVGARRETKETGHLKRNKNDLQAGAFL